jgi:hypothetical protein
VGFHRIVRFYALLPHYPPTHLTWCTGCLPNKRMFVHLKAVGPSFTVLCSCGFFSGIKLKIRSKGIVLTHHHEKFMSYMKWRLYRLVQESKGFWLNCITVRITGFVDFVRRPKVSETGSVPNSGGRREIPTLLGPLERANLNQQTRVGVSLPSPEDGNRSSFGTVVFYCI